MKPRMEKMTKPQAWNAAIGTVSDADDDTVSNGEGNT